MEEEEQQRRINQIYSGMEAWCTQEIEAFYGRYATAEGIDITEAKKRVSQADIEQYEALAKQYVKDRDFSDEANQAMRLYNATMKINRLELLKAQIGLHMVGGTDEIAQYYEETITNRTMDELERQSGILGKPLKEEDALKKAKNIVNASFYNATFSERIWSHCDNLRNEIGIELQKGLIAGVGSRQMAANLRKKYQASASDAHRLMVTELRRVQTDVALDSYKENGITEFEFLAVNPRACEICKEMDGKVFPVSELEAGVNAPPIHPRCHCTTAPHMDEDEYNAWLDNLAGDAPTATQTEAQEPEDTPFTPAKTEEVQNEALEWYASGEGMWINRYLRGQDDIELTEDEEILLDALSEATSKPIPKDIKKLWRSVDASAIFGDMTLLERSQLEDVLIYGQSNPRIERLIKSTEGKTITEDGFMSTTKNKELAEGFGGFTGSQTPVVLEFDTTKTEVLGKDMEDFEIEDDPQEEVLLHLGQKYEVNSIGIGEDEYGGKYIKINATFRK